MNVPRKSRYVTTVFCLRLLWDSIYDDWTKVTSDVGITVTEEQILWVIWLFDSCTVTEAARYLKRDKGTVSKCIYSLEESGLIFRQPGIDRRSYAFKITDEGERMRQNLERNHGISSVFARALNNLNEKEQKEFLSLLLKITEQIEGKSYTSLLVQSLARIKSALED
ncbi:MAG TPA: winged helix-turn-helix transcriptional regulator [Firmicutes bacterium]|nr:winged helix-turn-helix transcriptional regulator [Bacillota bacterium]